MTVTDRTDSLMSTDILTVNVNYAMVNLLRLGGLAPVQVHTANRHGLMLLSVESANREGSRMRRFPLAF